MRIIAGTAKGHKIKAVKGLNTRPTLDRIREAIFNVLGNSVINVNFLDLFAGTGAVGIEALSRGAKLCYFNDSNKKAYQIIQQNLETCHYKDNSKVFNMDVFRFFELLENKQECFDIIYVDPPYKKQLYDPILRSFETARFINQDGLIIIEGGKDLQLPQKTNKLKLVKKSSYGDTFILYYRYNKNGG